MATGEEGNEGVPANLRKQLAVAVRSIQWSYAIFWSLSATKQGVLRWGDGYYNGDIKTRKTVQAVELKPDKIGLQRSEQLRDLYESLLEGETDAQNKRPSAALSPEDLTDEEWYYLVCMSFVFNPGEGLPGRALADGETIWLCNAQYADSKVFSRSLLAKSASIQTVVCFPYLGGVIELGVTELVPEDPSLLQHIKVSLLDFSKPICSEKSASIQRNGEADEEPMCAKVDCDIVDELVLENLYSPAQEIKFDPENIRELRESIPKELDMDSLDECSNGCEHNYQTEDSFMVDGMNGGASQVQSWHFVDDDFSYGVQGSINSSDCISEAIVNQDKHKSSPERENAKKAHLEELQECNHSKLSSLDLGADDITNYRRTISAVLRNSDQLPETRCICSCGCKSSFVRWRMVEAHKPRAHQETLKKILFKVPLMHRGQALKSEQENGAKSLLGDVDFCAGHILSTKKKEHEKFLVLRSMIPSIEEIDKASILDDTILYLRELEARVEELESGMDSTDFEGKVTRKKLPDMIEQTSDNCKKRWINKRKASDIDETDAELDRNAQGDGLQSDVKVNVKEQEVLIEMKCPYREYLLLDILEAVNNLHLDTHSIQSSTLDGVLTLTLKSKFRGAALSPAGMIRQVLRKITWKY
ncbi:transcription factor EGL1-like [Rhodamnia argentea]|uniref:Transcription factor EGL1-like n=1 Tax=Rhodamnia argentea TaxID=178133 RepID=A0A8B8Q3D0_9MYRT|nr:transcription factor EGL1-like [Rhodamnia argentea]